jgi:predicted double-glycine peptidase
VSRLAEVAMVALLIPTLGVAEGGRPVSSMLELRQREVVRQQFDLSCGAAALATILRFQHGASLSERDVAIGMVSRAAYLENPDILKVRQGFSLLDMNNYVERLGYNGEALGRLSYDALLGLAPAIVPIRSHGYNHFVVFRGAFGNNVLLADPAFGNRTLSRDRFVASWIDYADLGHVAFIVQRRDGLIPPNRLSVSADDFPLLH